MRPIPDLRALLRQPGLSTTVLVVILGVAATVLAGIVAGWAFLEPLNMEATALLALLVLWCLHVVLIGIYQYDFLVLVTFGLVGFVVFEPAPFDLLLVVLLGIGLVTGRLRLPVDARETLVHVGLWGLAFVNLLSAVGVVPLENHLRFLSITLYVLALFAFVRMYADRPLAVKILFAAYTFSAAINVVAVILGFVGVQFPIPVLAFSIRAVGFFKDSNVYGPFIAVAVFWVVDLAVRRSAEPRRAVPLLLLGCLLGVGAVLSLSRAAWINLAVGGVTYLVLLARGASRQLVVRYLAAAAVVLVVIVLVIQLLGLGGAIQRRWDRHDYDTLRFETQRLGVQAGLAYPFGLGPGGLPNAHSLYIRTFAEQGVLGLISLGLLMLGLTYPLARRAWTEPGRALVIPDRVLLAMIAGLLVNSLVIDSIHWRHFWFVLGMSWASLGPLAGGQS